MGLAEAGRFCDVNYDARPSIAVMSFFTLTDGSPHGPAGHCLSELLLTSSLNQLGHLHGDVNVCIAEKVSKNITVRQGLLGQCWLAWTRGPL